MKTPVGWNAQFNFDSELQNKQFRAGLVVGVNRLKMHNFRLTDTSSVTDQSVCLSLWSDLMNSLDKKIYMTYTQVELFCNKLKPSLCSVYIVYAVFSEQSLAATVSKYTNTACTLSSSER